MPRAGLSMHLTRTKAGLSEKSFTAHISVSLLRYFTSYCEKPEAVIDGRSGGCADLFSRRVVHYLGIVVSSYPFHDLRKSQLRVSLSGRSGVYVACGASMPFLFSARAPHSSTLGVLSSKRDSIRILTIDLVSISTMCDV